MKDILILLGLTALSTRAQAQGIDPNLNTRCVSAKSHDFDLSEC